MLMMRRTRRYIRLRAATHSTRRPILDSAAVISQCQGSEGEAAVSCDKEGTQNTHEADDTSPAALIEPLLSPMTHSTASDILIMQLFTCVGLEGT